MLNGIPTTRNPILALKPYLTDSSVCLANLEVPLTDRGSRTAAKPASEVSSRNQFILRANPNHITWLAESGIDGVSLGNNHALDYGQAGLDQMIEALVKHHIGFAGAGDTRDIAGHVSIKKLPNGYTVGFISALAFQGGSALAKCTPARDQEAGVMTPPLPSNFKAWVERAKLRCQFLIVALHGGIERKALPSKYQIYLAHAFIDAGADLVWGNHPHVLEGGEIYKGKAVLYSCGNLISPTPARSGLFKLSYQGGLLTNAYFAGYSISGGRAGEPSSSPSNLAYIQELSSSCARMSGSTPLKFLPWEVSAKKL